MKNPSSCLMSLVVVMVILCGTFSCSKTSAPAITNGGNWIADRDTYTVTTGDRTSTSVIYMDSHRESELTCTFYGSIPTTAGPYTIVQTPTQSSQVGIVFNSRVQDYVADDHSVHTATISFDDNKWMRVKISGVPAIANINGVADTVILSADIVE